MLLKERTLVNNLLSLYIGYFVLPYLSAMYSVVVNLFLSQAQGESRVTLPAKVERVDEEADPCLMDKVIGKIIYAKYYEHRPYILA